MSKLREQVRQFKPGDRVYAVALANPQRGFYAEYTAVKTENVSKVPDKFTTEDAGVMPVDAVTGFGFAFRSFGAASCST